MSLVTVKQPQSLFRISTFRMEAGLDEKPTDTSIAQFLELLTAEMDAIALGTTSVDTGSAPSAKALQLDMEGKGNKNAEVDMVRAASLNMLLYKIKPNVASVVPARNTENRIALTRTLNHQRQRRRLGGVDLVREKMVEMEKVTKTRVQKETSHLKMAMEMEMEKGLEMEVSHKIQKWPLSIQRPQQQKMIP